MNLEEMSTIDLLVIRNKIVKSERPDKKLLAVIIEEIDNRIVDNLDDMLKILKQYMEEKKNA